MPRKFKRRAHGRYAIGIPVRIIAADGELSGTSVNISLGGVLVESTGPLVFGATVRLRFRLPALSEDTEVEATVRWNKGNSIGMQFGSFRARDVWALNKLFAGQQPL